MPRSRRPSDTPLLFDLPLAGKEGEPPGASGEPPVSREAGRRAARESEEGPLLFEEEWPPAPEAEPWPGPEAEEREEPAELARAHTGAALEAGPRPARIGERLKAGLADAAVHVGAGLAGVVGCELLGARPEVDDLPALALFLLAFSFLYTVIPLAFWGHTPGMAWAGLLSRAEGDQPLSFGQTVRRWLGGVLTALTLGLPLLLAVGGRSLADLVSGSRTYSAEP